MLPPTPCDPWSRTTAGTRLFIARGSVSSPEKGGTVSAASSLERFYRLWGPPTLRFRAHLPFYPSCTIQLFDEARVGAPIRIFHGTADDWTPIAPCREYVARLQSASVDARMIELPGAFHAFDVPTLPGSLYLPKVQNGARCRVVERAPGDFVDPETGRPAVSGGPCVGLGATVGYNASAQRVAAAAVKEFLRTTLTP
jgi:dienelactone hydrolase